MDNMFDMKWYEEVLFVAFFFLLIFSLLQTIYAIGVTALACMDKYSAEAAAFYWVYVGVTFILFVAGYGLFGIGFFVFCSPVIALVMKKIERSRVKNRKLLTDDDQQ